MKRKTVSGIVLTLLLTSMLTLAFNTQPVKASGTIWIRADGNVDPDTAPISTVDNITYTFTSNINDEIVVERDNIVVDGAGYTLQGTGSETGIDLSWRNNVTIKNTEIRSFDNAIWFQGSSKSNIVGNTIVGNTERGIMLSDSSNNSICRNILTTNNWGGICLYWSCNNSISENNVTNSGPGIYLHGSSNNNISGNNITESDSPAIYFEDSSDNSISENSITANSYDGILLGMSSNNSVYCNNITANNRFGIYLYRSSNSNTYGNNITSNHNGIYFEDSSNNSISGNTITNNDWNGIHLRYNSNYNAISSNNILNNRNGINIEANSNNNYMLNNYIADSEWDGIDLKGSHSNSIKSNTITNCFTGIYLGSETDNMNIIYHNNLINNMYQVTCYSTPNMWDDGYPSGGNYWSDYIAKGGYDADGDGIGDIPYVIDANNQDNYPLMEPWTPLPRNIDELKTEVEELGSEGQIDNQGIVKSLIAKLDVAEELIDMGKLNEAKRVLECFITQVKKLTSIRITEEAADILIQSAEYILSHL